MINSDIASTNEFLSTKIDEAPIDGLVYVRRDIVEGTIIPSIDGTIIGRFASEVANAAITTKAGSIVYYQQLV